MQLPTCLTPKGRFVAQRRLADGCEWIIDESKSPYSQFAKIYENDDFFVCMDMVAATHKSDRSEFIMLDKQDGTLYAVVYEAAPTNSPRKPPHT